MYGGNGAEGGDSGDDQKSRGWIDSPGAAAAATSVATGSDKFLSVRPVLHNWQQQQQQQRPSTAPQSSSSFSSGKSSNVNFEAPEPTGGRRGGDAGVSSSTTPTELHNRSVSGNTISSPNGSTTNGSATPAAVFGGREEAHHSPFEEDLITFPRFKPHALMQPTLFSTDDPAGGGSFHDGGILSGGDGEQGGEGDRGGGGGGAGRVEALKRAGAGGAKLLNAWEKIEELEGLVESSRSHNERLLEDLEEVQTDKVSMEYLLREKLERLVQSEIEARVARMHQDGGVDEILRRQLDGLRVEAAARARSEAVLREEIRCLKSSALAQRPLTERQGPDDEVATEVLARTTQELEELRCENAELRKQILSPALRREDANSMSENREAGKEGEDDRSSVAHDSAQEAALQDRCEALLGERKAMQTIMEQKVQVLVDNVADSACAVLDLVAASQSGIDNRRGGDGHTGSTDHAQVVLPSPSSAPAGGTGSTGEGEVSRAGTESSSSPAAREAAGRALSKDVGQLRRLVQAAITALRNADAEDQQQGITATASSPRSEEHDRKT
ncbi:kinesin-like protein [Ectocarpus siliculosus]|uniref:Kinesin-like protein n=1 Tax=Ectocarpus siliculosus TaxID=2880 RepID=D7FRU7_ECTSI|nr:kinesin-like protein [Ectocarpus siliculosus]|eukprot:CBJ30888.1 kinesin-like protein [Ectocarpus siliculosus]